MQDTLKTFDFNPSLIEVEVKELSFVKQHPRLMGNPHKVNFHQIIWVKEGSATFCVDFQNIMIHAGQMFVIAAGQVCQFDVISEYSGKLILFTESFFDMSEVDSNFLYTSETFNPTSLNRIVNVDNDEMSQLSSFLEKELKKSSDRFQTHIVHSYLEIILLEIERRLAFDQPLLLNSLGRLFYNAVEQHFRESRKTEYYAHLLNVSEKVLSKEVKALIGKTPKVYIDYRTILEAKRLLSYSAMSAKEIAFELGFDEPTNFHKYFIKHVGQTPLEFRESMKD
ncbi:helix-turn-helix domain-containing protein [Dysgonomonas massiliensis]|uniref:helix-turn-helix domain-containing protein n=1 Tax=Dysgonomonas massiliensis TaxID=2040292 RepID=UPI000C786A28|nr:helix-turn-helix domain-containing protein [Dysgonomonas massiliensis]